MVYYITTGRYQRAGERLHPLRDYPRGVPSTALRGGVCDFWGEHVCNLPEEVPNPALLDADQPRWGDEQGKYVS